MHGVASRARARRSVARPAFTPYSPPVLCVERLCVGRVPAPKSAQKPAPCRPEAGRQALFSMETARDPLFTPKNPVQSNQQPAKSGVNPVCGAARRAAPVRRNDRAGRSVASGARPPLFGDGGNAARDQGGGSLCRLGGVIRAPIHRRRTSSPNVDGPDKPTRYMVALPANGPPQTAGVDGL